MRGSCKRSIANAPPAFGVSFRIGLVSGRIHELPKITHPNEMRTQLERSGQSNAV
jgi:hypothetical protein